MINRDITIGRRDAGRWTTAQFVVRNVGSGVKEKLKRRAKRHGWSMEEEVRDILRCAVREEETPAADWEPKLLPYSPKTG